MCSNYRHQSRFKIYDFCISSLILKLEMMILVICNWYQIKQSVSDPKAKFVRGVGSPHNRATYVIHKLNRHRNLDKGQSHPAASTTKASWCSQDRHSFPNKQIMKINFASFANWFAQFVSDVICCITPGIDRVFSKLENLIADVVEGKYHNDFYTDNKHLRFIVCMLHDK